MSWYHHLTLEVRTSLSGAQYDSTVPTWLLTKSCTNASFVIFPLLRTSPMSAPHTAQTTRISHEKIAHVCMHTAQRERSNAESLGQQRTVHRANVRYQHSPRKPASLSINTWSEFAKAQHHKRESNPPSNDASSRPSMSMTLRVKRRRPALCQRAQQVTLSISPSSRAHTACSCTHGERGNDGEGKDEGRRETGRGGGERRMGRGSVVRVLLLFDLVQSRGVELTFLAQHLDPPHPR